MYIRALILALACLLQLGGSVVHGDTEQSKAILLPLDFHGCSLSPDGKYAALNRRVLHEPKLTKSVNSPVVYITQVLILDLETRQAVLAGRSEDPRDEVEWEDSVDRINWSKDGDLIVLTAEELMLVDPATGLAKKRRRLHSRLLDLDSAPLQDDWESPLLFYDVNWGRGASTALFSFSPQTGKLKKLTQPGLVKDVIVRVQQHVQAQAISLRPYAKDSSIGMTWELDAAGEMQTYPMNLPPEWEFMSVDRSVLGEGDLLMVQHLEDGDASAALRIFDFRENRFVGARVLVQRDDLETARSALTRASIETMKRGSGSISFREVANPEVIWLVSQLRNSYPLASVRKTSESADGRLISIWVASQNRPTALFTFDIEQRKLGKLVEGSPEWSRRELSTGRYLTYESEVEKGGQGVASYIPALNAEKGVPLVVSIAAEPLYDFDWGFSDSRRFLSVEGVDSLQIMIPWSLKLAIARSTSEAELAVAMRQCHDFLRTVLDRAVEEGVISARRTSEIYYCLYYGATVVMPALPDIEGILERQIIALNPRLMVGHEDIPLARLENLESYPLERYVDAKAWQSSLGSWKPVIDAPVKVIWREGDLSFWTGENSTEAQIESLRAYCNKVGVEYEIDRLPEGRTRSLGSWKMTASLTIGILETITGEDTGIMKKWY